jgi:pyroglutamyl-peptidase
MHTILLTGFGRFPGAPLNPSGALATRLAGRRRPALAGTRRVAHVFATSYDAVDRELPALLAREKPGIVVMFGVATRSRGVRIEERARNRIALAPDAGRRRPPAQTIALSEGARRNTLPLDRLVTAARATGVATVRSRNAGSYLCNYVYWRGLEAAGQPDGPEIVIFVHVPPVAVKQTPRRPASRTPEKKTLSGRPAGKKPLRRPAGPVKVAAQRRRASLDDLVRAGEAIVLTTASLAPARSHPAALPEAAPARVSPAQVSPAQVSPAQVSPAQVSPVQVSPAQVSPAQASPAQASPAQVSPVQVVPAQVSPAQVSPAQVSPAARSAEQDVTARDAAQSRANGATPGSRPSLPARIFGAVQRWLRTSAGS